MELPFKIQRQQFAMRNIGSVELTRRCWFQEYVFPRHFSFFHGTHPVT